MPRINPQKLSLTPLSPASLPRAVSRRILLQGAGIGGASLLLAACSSSAPKVLEAAVDKSQQQKSLRFDSRDTYRNTVGEDFPLLGAFSESSGIAVTYTNAVSDDNVYYSKVKGQLKLGQDIGADAVVLSDWMAARWVRMGYVQELDVSALSNFENLRVRFKQSGSAGSRAFLPWRSGFTGIAWNKAAFPDGLTSVSELWDPALAGKVGVMSGMRDTIGLIMLDQGVDISDSLWGDVEFSAAVEVLRAQVSSGQLTSIKGNKYMEDLKSGATVAAIARAGDVMQINQEAGDQWGFALPASGAVLWDDVVVIPIGSTHLGNALSFIDYYYDRGVAAQVAADTSFISPIEIRTPEINSIPAEIARNLLVFPSEATLSNTKTFRTLTQGEEQRYGAQYQTVLLSGA